MTLIINNKSKEEGNEILVSFGKTVLRVSENSEDWNNQGINNFLIKLASSTPDGEKIKIDFDSEDENKVYKHIVELFTSFTDEYNKSVE